MQSPSDLDRTLSAFEVSRVASVCQRLLLDQENSFLDNCHEDSGDALYKKFIEEFMYSSKRAYSERTPPLFIPRLFWRLSDLSLWEPAHTFLSII
jgi:hypothetical protein